MASSQHVQEVWMEVVRLKAWRPVDWAVFTRDAAISAGGKILGMESVPMLGH